MPRKPKQPTPACRMTPAQAGKIIGISADLVEEALKQGIFPEWGRAIPRQTSTGTTWRYMIFKRRFELYMAGADLGGEHIY